MSITVIVHFSNSRSIRHPRLWYWTSHSGSGHEIKPRGEDAFGYFFEVISARSEFFFKFRSGIDTQEFWEDDSLNRCYRWYKIDGETVTPNEVWCTGENAFVHHVLPQAPESQSAEAFITNLPWKKNVFKPDTGGISGLGATVLNNGKVLFGLYHPNAACVYVTGSFNNWERPVGIDPPSDKCIRMKRYTGYFDIPNIWLAVVDNARAGDEYKFVVQGGVASNEAGPTLCITDPYARAYRRDISTNNAIIIDPTRFKWSDRSWKTPHISELIIYELSVSGFTEEDHDIPVEHRGTFKGITDRIRTGYFNNLGITALEIIPFSESSSRTDSTCAPSSFFTVERDFGSPDDLRQLVDNAHRQGIAVILDQIFNHTNTCFNPLWRIILEHPDEEYQPHEGGLYFQDCTAPGNRIATGKDDVQYFIIDSCKLFLKEYHIDGFRFDPTQINETDHLLMKKLGNALKTLKHDIILITDDPHNQQGLNPDEYCQSAFPGASGFIYKWETEPAMG